MNHTRKLLWAGLGVLTAIGVGTYATRPRPAAALGAGRAAESREDSPLAARLRSVLRPDPVRTLRTVRVLGDTTTFGRIEDVEPINAELLVIDVQGRNTLMVVDTATGTLARAAGRRGHGPGEYVSAKSLDRSGPAQAWVYDFNGRMSLVDMARLDAEPQRILQTDAGLLNPVWMGDTLVSNGMFAGELLRVYTAQGTATALARAAGHTPFPRVVPEVAMHLNRSALAASPDRSRIAQAFLYTSRLQFYGRDGRILRAVAGPEEVTPEYRVVDDPREKMSRFLRSDATRFSYIDVTATDERVYALFSGRSRGEYEEEAYAATQLHVFDWEGTLVGVWTLDQDVRRITVDPVSGALYGVRDLPFPAIVRFQSPDV